MGLSGYRSLGSGSGVFGWVAHTGCLAVHCRRNPPENGIQSPEIAPDFTTEGWVSRVPLGNRVWSYGLSGLTNDGLRNRTSGHSGPLRSAENRSGLHRNCPVSPDFGFGHLGRRVTASLLLGLSLGFSPSLLISLSLSLGEK
jgi:hypothetical protein